MVQYLHAVHAKPVQDTVLYLKLTWPKLPSCSTCGRLQQHGTLLSKKLAGMYGVRDEYNG